MFKKIVLRRSECGANITLGELAQAMFFYQHVHIIFDRDTTIGLIKLIGCDRLLALISRDTISAVYLEDDLSVQNLSLAYNHYSFASLTVMGGSNGVVLKSSQERLASQIVEWCKVSKGNATSFSLKFFSKVRVRKYVSDYFVSNGIIQAAQNELTDTNLLHETTRRVLETSLGTPEIGPFKIEANKTSKGFVIETDINFSGMKYKNQLTGESSDLTLSLLLINILQAKSDNLLAAFYDGDIYTSALSSQIISIRHEELIKKITGDKENIKLFDEIVIQNASPIKELINSNQRSYDEFLILLDKAERFRSWANGLEPDKKLVAEYMNEINSSGWLSTASAKLVRFLLCTGLGVIEPTSGLALSVADAFLVDKLAKGWRPNQFVEKDLKPFMSPNIDDK